MLMRVCYIDYEESNNEVIVRIAGRTEGGDRRILHVWGTHPYAYYPEEEPTPNKDFIVDEEYGYESYDGQPLKKIKTELPKQTNEVKGEFSRSFEADLPYYRRQSLQGLSGYIEVPDHKRSVNIEDINTEPEYDGEIEPRVMIGDIEVLPDMDKTVEESVEQAEEPVVAITLWDSFEDEYCAIILDEDHQVDGSEVRRHMKEHWDDSQGDYSKYADSDVVLKRCNSEEALLNEFVRYVAGCRPDVISGWNFTSYDWTYLLNRMMKFDGVNQHKLSDVGTTSRPGWNVERAVDGLPAFDMMKSFAETMTFHDWRSKSLDYVCNEEFGMGKVEDADVHTDYNRHRSRFLAYNIVDVELCVELDRINNIHQFFYGLAEESSLPIYDVHSELRLVDGYILSRRDDDEILPTAKESEIEQPIGGLVLSPSNGIIPNVNVQDLKSLYPSSMITCNISPEVMTNDPDEADVVVPMMPETEDSVGGTITENDIDWSLDGDAIGFSLNEEGIVPKYLKLIFRDRKEAKQNRNQYESGSAEYNSWDRQQAAIKVVMNSMYGVLNSKYFRLSQTGLGDAITSAGRYTLWRGSEIAEKMGFEISYGDTDSIMVSLSDDGEGVDELVELADRVEGEINSQMENVADSFGIPDEHPHLTGNLHGTKRHLYYWENEKLYAKFLQMGSKKRYSGRLIWKEGQKIDPPEEDVTGFESQRSDTPEIVSEAQPEVIGRILGGEDFESISDYIQSIIEDLEEGNRPIREFALPGTINKPLEDYPNRETPRACEYGNEYLDRNWSVGDTPFVVYVKSTPIGLPSENVLAIEWNEEVPDGFEVDHEAIIERALHKPLKPIIEEMGWDFDELRSGRRTESLTSGESSSGDPFGGGSSGDSGSELPW